MAKAAPKSGVTKSGVTESGVTESGVTDSCVPEIGETAGVIWERLSSNGDSTVAKLVKEVDQSRDVVMQALGWLAREEKVEIVEKGRSRIVRLR